MVIVLSISLSFRFSFGLTNKTPLTKEVTVVPVVMVERVVILIAIPSVISVAHGIVSVSTIPVVPLSISFSLRLSKDRKDKEGRKNLKQLEVQFGAHEI